MQATADDEPDLQAVSTEPQSKDLMQGSCMHGKTKPEGSMHLAVMQN
jgi:hypothetical protein